MPSRGSVRRAKLVPLLVAAAMFMELLDGTIIVTALPAMARTFHVPPVDLNLGMTAYMLTLAVMIPASGWIAERHGARNVFSIAIAIFTTASLLCAFTNDVWSFTAARVLQGFGGALMVPIGRLIVLRTVEKRDLVSATATITWPALMAPIIAPPLGGFITAYASWRWIFYLNLPLGLIGIAFTWMLIGNARAEERRRLDWLGLILIGAATVSLVYGLSLIGQTKGDWRVATSLLVVAVGLSILAFKHAERAEAPLLNLAAFAITTYSVCVRGGSIERVAIYAVPFLLPLLFQLGFGMNAFNSGLLVLALFAGNLAIKPATTPLMRRFGFRNILLVNGMLLAASIAAIGTFVPTTARTVIVVVLVVSGMARSMQFTALNTLAFADVPKPNMAPANTFFSLVFHLANGLGVAVGVVALRGGAVLAGSGSATSLGAFHIAFPILGVLTLLGVLDNLRLKSDAGTMVSRHRRYVTPAASSET